MFLTIFTSFLTAALTGIITFSLQERKLRSELRTEFRAEAAIKLLLETERWQKRSFIEIKKRIGGFEDDELRKLLVRSGAVRFEGAEGKEFWGLISRNMNEI